MCRLCVCACVISALCDQELSELEAQRKVLEGFGAMLPEMKDAAHAEPEFSSLQGGELLDQMLSLKMRVLAQQKILYRTHEGHRSRCAMYPLAMQMARAHVDLGESYGHTGMWEQVN